MIIIVEWPGVQTLIGQKKSFISIDVQDTPFDRFLPLTAYIRLGIVPKPYTIPLNFIKIPDWVIHNGLHAAHLSLKNSLILSNCPSAVDLPI